MRVVGGSLGGRPLLAPRGWKVRPTPERAREAIFSALGDVTGLTVLDLFCGTGALAIEALSRGAATATLVDRDLRPAEGNVLNLDLSDRCLMVKGKVVEEAGALVGRAMAFDLIFLDPPYDLWSELPGSIGGDLASLLAPEGRVIAESEGPRPPEFPGLEKVRERRYGRSLITFHAHPPGEQSRKPTTRDRDD